MEPWIVYIIITLIFISTLIYLFIKNPKFKNSLETHLGLAFILVSVISLMPFIIITIWHIENIIINKTGNDIANQAIYAADYIKGRLKKEIDPLINLSKNKKIIFQFAQTSEATLSSLPPKQRELRLLKQSEKWYKKDYLLNKAISENAASKLLIHFLKESIYNKQIIILDRYGSMVAYAGNRPIHYYYSDFDWWKKVLQLRYKNTIIINNFKVNPLLSRSTFYISIPVFMPHTQAFRGVLCAKFDLYKFKPISEKNFYEKQNTFHLMRPDNTIIYSNQLKTIGKKSFYALSHNEIKNKKWKIVTDQNGNNVIVTQIGIFSSNRGNRNPNHQLLISVHQKVGDSLNQIQNLKIFVIIGGIVIFILAAFIGRIFSRQLANPIKKLTRAVTNFSNNNFPSVKEYGYGEIKTLSIAYNQMAQNLNTTMINLKNKIKEKRESNKEIDKLQNLLTNILNSMPSIIIGVDKKGYVTLWNQHAEQATGIKNIKAKNKPFYEVLPQLNFEKEKVFLAISQKRPLKEEKIVMTFNEDSRYINILIYPLISKENQGAVIRLDDVTNLVKKEAVLNQNQKMETVGILAGGLAHDFNNVLGGIVGTVSLLKFTLDEEKKINNKDLYYYLNILNVSTDRATNIVQQLLSLSNNQDLNFTPLDLNRSLKNIVEICKNSFDKSITIIPKYFTHSAIINGDQTQVEQVLLNFCINAAHAMTIMQDDSHKKGGLLTITIDMIKTDYIFKEIHPEAIENNYWIVSIKDTGVGIPKQIISKIFTPYFTTKKKGTGSGLGLSVIYNIVQKHNGFIDVYSEEGIGTTFNIFFPIDENSADIELGEKKEPPIQKGDGLILVIDDDPVVQQTAVKILERCGYTTLLAENGKKGIDLFKNNKNKIKAVLLDMVMPGMSGKETYIKLKEINSQVKVLLSSGFINDENVKEAINLGVNSFIQKPYSLNKLSLKIAKVISSR